mmetsp:Transcript_29013/g.68180  ORF Transcript_29013/g.68180 Transcript_29013/m.68180 type:complete len:106 (+) Transcript_29013:3913-4230(+)
MASSQRAENTEAEKSQTAGSQGFARASSGTAKGQAAPVVGSNSASSAVLPAVQALAMRSRKQNKSRNGTNASEGMNHKQAFSMRCIVNSTGRNGKNETKRNETMQ